MDEAKKYCACPLPIRMVRHTSDNYMTWYCAKCGAPVDPNSKMITKYIEKLDLQAPTRNEIIIQNKINEILELMGANGDFVQ